MDQLFGINSQEASFANAAFRTESDPANKHDQGNPENQSQDRKFTYTTEQLLSFYSPYLRPPKGFQFHDKVTSRTPLGPLAFSTTTHEPTSFEPGEFHGGRGRGGRGGRGRGERGFQKSEYGWGREEQGGEPKPAGRGRGTAPVSTVPPWKKNLDKPPGETEHKPEEPSKEGEKPKTWTEEREARLGRERLLKESQELPRDSESHPSQPPNPIQPPPQPAPVQSPEPSGPQLGPIATGSPATQLGPIISQPQQPIGVPMSNSPIAGVSQDAAQIHAATLSWYYLDPTGKERGPFPGANMEKWLDRQYFSIDLQVRTQDQLNYTPLALWFIKDQRNPFTGMPLQQWWNLPKGCAEFKAALWQFIQNQAHEQMARQQMQQAAHQPANPPGMHHALHAPTPVHPQSQAVGQMFKSAQPSGPIFGPTTGNASQFGGPIFGPPAASNQSGMGMFPGASTGHGPIFGPTAQQPSNAPSGPIFGPSTSQQGVPSTTGPIFGPTSTGAHQAPHSSFGGGPIFGPTTTSQNFNPQPGAPAQGPIFGPTRGTPEASKHEASKPQETPMPKPTEPKAIPEPKKTKKPKAANANVKAQPTQQHPKGMPIKGAEKQEPVDNKTDKNAPKWGSPPSTKAAPSLQEIQKQELERERAKLESLKAGQASPTSQQDPLKSLWEISFGGPRPDVQEDEEPQTHFESQPQPQPREPSSHAPSSHAPSSHARTDPPTHVRTEPPVPVSHHHFSQPTPQPAAPVQSPPKSWGATGQSRSAVPSLTEITNAELKQQREHQHLMQVEYEKQVAAMQQKKNAPVWGAAGNQQPTKKTLSEIQQEQAQAAVHQRGHDYHQPVLGPTMTNSWSSMAFAERGPSVSFSDIQNQEMQAKHDTKSHDEFQRLQREMFLQQVAKKPQQAAQSPKQRSAPGTKGAWARNQQAEPAPIDNNEDDDNLGFFDYGDAAPKAAKAPSKSGGDAFPALGAPKGNKANVNPDAFPALGVPHVQKTNPPKQPQKGAPQGRNATNSSAQDKQFPPLGKR